MGSQIAARLLMNHPLLTFLHRGVNLN